MSKRAYEHAFSSTPAGMLVTANGFDAPRPQVLPTSSPFTIYIPGQWPAEDVAIPEEPSSFFSTVGRWASTALNVANQHLLHLPQRLAQQYWHKQQIVALPVVREDGSHKKRLVDAGAVEESTTPSPARRARATRNTNATRRHFFARNTPLSPSIWSPSPEKAPVTPLSPPHISSYLTHLTVCEDLEESLADHDADDESLDFSFSDILTSTPPRNPQTDSPVSFSWSSPQNATTKDISGANPVTPMRRQLLKLQLRACATGVAESDINANGLSSCEVDSSPVRSDVDSSPFPSDVDSSPFQSDVDSSPFQSDVDSSPFQSDVDSSPFQSDVGSSPMPATKDYENDLSFLCDAEPLPARRTVRWASHAGTKPFYFDEKISEMLDSSLESITSNPIRPDWYDDEDEDLPLGEGQDSPPASPSPTRGTCELQQDIFAEIGEMLGVSEDAWDSPDESIDESQISVELLEDLQEDLKKKMALTPPTPPPMKSLIAPLSDEEMKTLGAVAEETEFGENASAYVVDEKLSVMDFATLLPEIFNGNPKAWLNDNIVNEYLAILVNYRKAEVNYEHVRGGEAPAVHSFSSFWYPTMKSRPDSVGRWASRFQLGGKQYLDADLLLYPICDGGHWRLLAIKPKERTIEYFDSLGFSGKPYIAKAFEYLEMELKEAFIAEEWIVIQKQRSSRQLNGSDCGVFTVLNALVLLRGEGTERVIACDGMGDARERIATTLIAGIPTMEME